MSYKKMKLSALSILCLTIIFINTASAQISFPPIFSDNMVLQQNKPINIWGWADVNEKITVTINNSTSTTTANQYGEWKLNIPEMTAGGPHEISVTGSSSPEIKFKNVMIGEVWICSGQSNMNWPIKNTLSAKETENISCDNLRIFTVPVKVERLPQNNFADSKWRAADGNSIKSFSAVGYYFASKLHNELKIPVGIIQSSWSGTTIDAWTPLEGFENKDSLKKICDNIKRYRSNYLKALPKYLTQIQNWIDSSKKAIQENRFPPTMPENPVIIHQIMPTSIFNAMINPIIPYTIQGVIWYQGESNARDGILYYDKMHALVGGWRKLWKQGDFPFYYVQLPPCRIFYKKKDSLPILWEAQTKAQDIPNSGMVVISDTVRINALHPRNKKDVGERLAKLALAKTYKINAGEYSGPVLKKAEFMNDKIIIHFSNAEDGLYSRDKKPLSDFEISYDSKNFIPAKAEIVGNTVVIHLEGKQTKVKEVWFCNKNTSQPNLMNKSGLPAAPFKISK